MGRYNTVIATSTAIAGTYTMPAPFAGIQELGGTAPYTVTMPSPVLFPGTTQTFYNTTSGVVTLSLSGVTPAGNIIGPATNNTSVQTYAMPTGAIFTVYSDGVNWLSINNDSGGPFYATTGSFSGVLTATGGISATTGGNNQTFSTTGSATISLSSGGIGSIANMTIGSSSPQSGAFTSLSASSAVTLTGGGAATAYNTSGAALLVTGGAGISGALYTNSTAQFANTLTVTSGGASITGSVSLPTSSGTTLTVSSTAQGSNASTGNALQVAGGVGIQGTLYTVGLTETSSIAFKENVMPIGNVLDRVMNLVGVTYDRKEGRKNEAGLIAEEVYKVIPEIVSTDKEGKPYGIQYTKLSVYLLEAIKSLKQEINELKGSK